VLREGPLIKAGMNIKPGTIIESIDGVAIAADRNIVQNLNRKAGKLPFGLFGTARHAATSSSTVHARRRESPALQCAIKKNADDVSRLSNGQLGYVHIPA
jgi:C-terminal processing protease CtpA/Prc